MPNWIALSDQDTPPNKNGAAALMHQGALVLELALPLNESCVLLDYRVTDGWLRALSIFYDPAAGISILHRQGATLARHTLPGPLPVHHATARVVLRWDAPARTWQLRYEIKDAGLAMQSRGTNPLPLPVSDLIAVCAGKGLTQRHPALLWFGATQGDNPLGRTPWIGLRTPIASPGGYRHAGSLRPGDMVLAQDGGTVPIRSVQKMTLPSRGHFSPVLLRAPFFSRQTDLLVSADQLVSLTGPEVEYLFGEDEVLASAEHLVDGRSALLETRRANTACVSLDLGDADMLESQGCYLVSAQHSAPTTLPRRLLHGYEAVPLLALLGRGSGSRAA